MLCTKMFLLPRGWAQPCGIVPRSCGIPAGTHSLLPEGLPGWCALIFAFCSCSGPVLFQGGVALRGPVLIVDVPDEVPGGDSSDSFLAELVARGWW